MIIVNWGAHKQWQELLDILTHKKVWPRHDMTEIMLKTPLNQSLDFDPWAAFLFNPLAHMRNLVSNLATNKDMMQKYGQTGVQLTA